MNPQVVIKILDLVLMGINISPQVLEALIGLRSRLMSGEEISEEDIDALVSRIQERSKIIQNA